MLTTPAGRFSSPKETGRLSYDQAMLGPALQRRVCCCAILTTIALTGVTPAAAEDEEGSACPPNLRVWRSHGSAEPGGQWQADVLEINGDIAILREVLIRFGDGTLPADEARWFDPPSVLEPDALRTRTLSFMGEELRSFCRHLTGSQIDTLREKSRSKCLVTDSGVRLMLRGMLTVTDADVEESDRRTDGGPYGGFVSRPTKGTRMGRSASASCMRTAGVSRRTMPRRSAGFVSRPSRDTTWRS